MSDVKNDLPGGADPKQKVPKIGKPKASVGDFHFRLPSAPKGECNCALYTQYREGEKGKERDSVELGLVDGVATSVVTLNGAEAPEGYCPSAEDLLAAGFVRF